MRTAELELSGLTIGETYQVAAIGQDFAGNWQPEEEATLSRTWEIHPSEGVVQLSEIVANAELDYIELTNPSARSVSLGGWTLSDREEVGSGYVFPDGTRLDQGYAIYSELVLGFALEASGESVYLRDAGGHLVDSLTFGIQAPSLALGRVHGV